MTVTDAIGFVSILAWPLTQKEKYEKRHCRNKIREEPLGPAPSLC